MSEDQPFTLTNEAPRSKPWRAEDDPRRQQVLLEGLDCCAGQLDLFTEEDQQDGR